MSGGSKYKIGVREIFYYLPKISLTHRLVCLTVIQRTSIKKIPLQIILIYKRAYRLPYWITEKFLTRMKETKSPLCES